MKPLELVVREYRHWHLGTAVVGNTLFVVGSVLFFKTFEAWQTFAVWLFVLGSSLMLLGALGEWAKAVYERRERDASVPPRSQISKRAHVPRREEAM